MLQIKLVLNNFLHTIKGIVQYFGNCAFLLRIDEKIYRSDLYELNEA